MKRQDPPPSTQPRDASTEPEASLLSRVDVIEAQPLAERAAGFEQLHDELLAELQRGDHGDA